MKLSDWAEKQGIAYLTAYRWFKAGKLPVKAYQSESGTIIVKDESEVLTEPLVSENNMNNDVMSLFLKKTVEYSKNNSTVEDFAAYVLSTFSLKINYGPDNPKYSKNKPKPEDIQKHFKQFIPQVEKPKPNMFVAEIEDSIDDLVARSDQLTKQELVSEIHKIGEESSLFLSEDTSVNDMPEVKDLAKHLSVVLNASGPSALITDPVTTYKDLGHNSMISRSNLTPQHHTNSTPAVSPITLLDESGNPEASATISFNGYGSTGSFMPTQKELEMTRSLSIVAPAKRRGRKSKGSK